mmetsp:Transcript_40019/g.44809  ORF Transcript_40019/g.44809 Transcript_40019/m.44809 type:complete len:93 (-) Transcript_40019:1498-1776(-)
MCFLPDHRGDIISLLGGDIPMDQGIQATLLEKSSSKVSPTIFEDEITNINTMWIGLTDRPKKGWQGLCAILNGHRSNNSSSDDDDDERRKYH